MEKEFSLQKFDTGMHYIILTEEIVKPLTKGNNKRVICRLNNEIDIHCAIMSSKEVGHYINIGKAVCKKLRIQQGSKLKAQFSVDTTAYQFEMPEELKEVLDTDEQANNVFHSLTKGNQRGLIYLVLQVKSSDKRIERALKIAEKIKMGLTSPSEILKK